MADIVFGSQDNDEIEDLLHAWTSHNIPHELPLPLEVYARHLVGLKPSSQRLRQLVIHAIGAIGYQVFEQVGVEGLFELLNHLNASVEHINAKEGWAVLLMDIIQSFEGIQHLPCLYWELLVELLILESQLLEGVTWSPHVMESLEGNQEWDKLECWMGIVWMVWPPEADSITEKDVQHVILSLFHQQPGAIQKLEQWIEQWGKSNGKVVPKSFQQGCEQVHIEVAQQIGL